MPRPRVGLDMSLTPSAVHNLITWQRRHLAANRAPYAEAGRRINRRTGRGTRHFRLGPYANRIVTVTILAPQAGVGRYPTEVAEEAPTAEGADGSRPTEPTAAAAEDGNPLPPLGARCRPVGITPSPVPQRVNRPSSHTGRIRHCDE
jgi:hypothetical protein